jgi:hypothetical protein
LCITARSYITASERALLRTSLHQIRLQIRRAASVDVLCDTTSTFFFFYRGATEGGLEDPRCLTLRVRKQGLLAGILQGEKIKTLCSCKLLTQLFSVNIRQLDDESGGPTGFVQLTNVQFVHLTNRQYSSPVLHQDFFWIC